MDKLCNNPAENFFVIGSTFLIKYLGRRLRVIFHTGFQNYDLEKLEIVVIFKVTL